MEAVRRILKEALKEKKMIIFLLFLMLFSAALDLTVPFIGQQLIDRIVSVFTEQTALSLSFIVLAGAAIFIITIIGRFLNNFYEYRLFTFVTTLEDELRFKAYERYLSLHALYHHEVNSGQIIGRIDRGATGVYEILYDIIGRFIVQPAFIVILIAGALFYKDPVIALLVIAPLPVFILIIIPLAAKIYEKEKKAHDIFEQFSKEQYDVAANVMTVKHFGQESRETSGQKLIRNSGRKYQYAAERYWRVTEMLQTTVSAVGRVAVIVVSGYFTLIGRNTVGELVLFLTLQGMAYQPLWQLSVLFAILRRATARAERLFKVLDEKPGVTDKQNAHKLAQFKKNIEFKNVSFYYRKERQILHDVDVVIPAGNMVALVGRSGSGKSTFVNLILRSFDPQNGEVYFDGYNIASVTQKSLRDQISIVTQEVDLFSRTIAENIAYGKPDAPVHEIAEAARLAYAHDFIMKLPDGYQTLVGERGVKLSGGEKQRIGIARAILRNPEILILDEATSHLDSESEKIVQKATRHLIKGRTSIVIAHRLSTILHADKILVFDHGHIVGEGTHKDLLQGNEIYRRLYNLQFEENS